MRKKLLSLALLALVVCSAWAQEAPTKPIPTFSALADNGTSLQYLYNVDAQAFVLGANDWDTRASVSTDNGYLFKVKNNGNGTWTLNDYVETQNAWKAVYAGKWDDIWVDNLGGANVNGWVITLNDDGVTYSITNPGTGEGKLAASGFPDDTRLYLSNDGKYDKWAFVNLSDWFSSSDNPIDLTYCVGTAQANWVGAGGTYSNCVEHFIWAGTATGEYLSQTVHKLPIGKYEVELYCAASSTSSRDNGGATLIDPDGDDSYVTLHANDVAINIPAYNRTGIDGDIPSYKLENVKVKDGSLKMWVNIEKPNPNWIVANIKSLKYLGEDLDSYIEALETLVEQAEGLCSSKMKASVLTALQAEILNAQSVSETLESLKAETVAMQTAIANANASVAEYNKISPFNAMAAQLDEDGQAAYASTLQAYNEGSLTYASEAEAAFRAAVKSQTTEGADMTGAIVNPSFDGNINGWTDTYTVGNHGYQGAHYENGGVVVDKFMECWIWGTNLGNGSLYQVIEGLPEGEYTMSADIISCRQDQTVDQTGVYIFAKSDVLFKSDACSTANNAPQTFSFNFKMTGETLNLGLMTESTNCNWVAFDNVRLTYNGPLKSNIYQDQLVASLATYPETITDEDLSDEVKSAYAATYASVLEASQTDSQSDEYYINALEELQNAYAAIEQARQAVQIARTAAEAGTSPYTGSELTAGTFYLYNVQAGKFMQGANDWGTRISLCEAGQPMVLAGSNGVYTIDSQISNGNDSHYVGTGGYLDGAAYGFTFIPANVDNMYAISFGENNLAYDGNSLVATANTFTSGSFWQLVSADDIKAAAVANATEENPFDVSSLVLDQNFGRNNTLSKAWSNSHNGGDFQLSAGNNNNNNMQQWNGTFSMGQTISNLPNGLYKVTFQGFYRNGTNDGAASAYQGGTEVLRSFVDVNGTSVAVKSVMSEAQTTSGNGFDKETSCGFVPNSQANAGDAFTAGYYQNEPIEVFVVDGKLTITACCKENVGDSWTVLDNFKLYYVCPLEDAIDRMASQIVNGDFEADYSVVSGTGVSSDRAIYQPNGWTVSYKGDSNDMTILNSGDLASGSFTSITALANGGDNTYLYRGKWGSNTNIEVYQYVYLPAGTYTLTCDAWKSGLGGNGTIFVGSQTATLDANATEWKPLKLEFTVTDEYEIVKVGFNIIHNSDGSEKFIGFDNFKICDASATMSVSATAQYGTFIAPFDVTVPEGVKAYSCYVINDNTLDLAELDEPAIPANTPVILYAENGYANTFYGVNTATEDAYENGYLTGVYADTKAPAGSYVLQNGGNGVKFYVVEEGKEPTVKANRCYLNLPEGSDVKAFGFSFGEVDAINSINADKKQNDGAIYNLNGQRLNSLQKGLNIVNGKKLFVK